MNNRYYLDSAIWRDYYENRSDRFRPLGDWALALINKIIQNEWIIIYSDFVVRELSIKYTEEGINNIFQIARKEDLLFKVDMSDFQVKEATILCKNREVAFGDALHSILARDNKAIMVTRDKHFINLTDIAEIKKPEELI